MVYLQPESQSLYPKQPPMVGHTSLTNRHFGDPRDMQLSWNGFQIKKPKLPEANKSLYQEQPSLKLSEFKLKPRIWTSVSHFTMRRGTHS